MIREGALERETANPVEAALDRFRNPAGRVSPAFGLDEIRRALSALGDPQDRIPRAVHITGTNGKGSTAAFLRAIAEASGLRVHVFISPHLIRVNERIRVAGKLVEDEALIEALEDVAHAGPNLTYFEALTAAAFLIFSREPAEMSIIEVGAGGLLDATNVMAHPAACAITPISRDHEAMFGLSGEAAIARLKSGVLRKDVPAVLSAQLPIVLGVLREEARKLGAPVFAEGRNWTAGWEGSAFVYQGESLSVRAPWLGLRGRHQAQNAGTACAIAEAFADPRIKADAIAAGLREAAWPARMQKLAPGPIAHAIDGEVWIDGAHNPAGAQVLADCIRDLPPLAERERTAIVIALQAAKDAGAVMNALAPVADDVIACALPPSGGQEGGAGADAGDLAQLAQLAGAHAMKAADFEEALLLARAARAKRVIFCGSLYLCGAVLRANGETIS